MNIFGTEFWFTIVIFTILMVSYVVKHGHPPGLAGAVGIVFTTAIFGIAFVFLTVFG